MILTSKEQAQGFASELISVAKTMQELESKYKNISPCYGMRVKEVHLYGAIELLAELLCCSLEESPFSEKFDELYFYYAGYKFFELRRKVCSSEI